jgi:hypothetical protein
MVLIIGVFVTAAVALLISKLRARRGNSGENLGWMSEQWLSEWRASHQP